MEFGVVAGGGGGGAETPAAGKAGTGSVKQSQAAVEIDGVRTEVIVIQYADRNFVTVTQLKKLGSILLATVEKSEATGMKSYEVNTLLGRRDDPLLTIYGRQLMEQINSPKPLLLAVALKDEGRDSFTFQTVINVVLGLLAEPKERKETGGDGSVGKSG